MMKILIVKTSALGDIVQTFPVLVYLKARFPEATIDWVVEKQHAELVRAHPLVNQVFLVQTKQWRSAPFSRNSWHQLKAFCQELRQQTYDVVFDLQGNLKSGLVTALAKAVHKVGFDRKSAPERLNTLFTNRRYNPPNGQNIRSDYMFIVRRYYQDPTVDDQKSVLLQISDDEWKAITNILKDPALEKGTKVMVCPGSAWPNKQVSFQCLVDFLKEVTAQCQGCYLFAWGSLEEKEFAKKLHEHFPTNSFVMERVSLPALQNLMGHVDLVVAMDSLPLHLAATTHTPTFSVFGASSADKYKPEGKRHFAFQGLCPYGRTFVKRCPVLRTCPTGSCIKDIQGETLFEAFLLWYRKI